ncbi:MAG TPA: hypothetical protein VGH08_04655 [Chthoniobacterales bacterium]
MGHVANMDADLQLDMAFGRHVMIEMSKLALNLDRALCRFQRTLKLHQERVANGFDLSSMETRKDFPQQLAMFL